MRSVILVLACAKWIYLFMNNLLGRLGALTEHVPTSPVVYDRQDFGHGSDLKGVSYRYLQIGFSDREQKSCGSNFSDAET